MRSISVRHFARAFAFVAVPWKSMASVSARPTRCFGFSEPSGFWNTICIFRQSALMRFPARRWPFSSTSPDAGFKSPVATRATVDLPEPDSPTSPTMRCGVSARSTFFRIWPSP